MPWKVGALDREGGIEEDVEVEEEGETKELRKKESSFGATVLRLNKLAGSNSLILLLPAVKRISCRIVKSIVSKSARVYPTRCVTFNTASRSGSRAISFSR